MTTVERLLGIVAVLETRVCVERNANDGACLSIDVPYREVLAAIDAMRVAALEGAQQREQDAQRTIASIATMLGWMNVPPQRTLESDIAALKARALRAEAAEARLAASEAVVNALKQFVAKERALRDWVAGGRGGQHVGTGPSISPSTLKALEHILNLAIVLGEGQL